MTVACINSKQIIANKLNCFISNVIKILEERVKEKESESDLDRQKDG